jgi:predicted peptidase
VRDREPPRSRAAALVPTLDVPTREFELRRIDVAVGGTQQTHFYHVRGPAAYRAPEGKTYPLVVYLHAWGFPNTEGELDAHRPHAPESIQKLPESSKYAAFVYVPVCPPPYRTPNEPAAAAGGEWNSAAARAMVVATIKHLVEGLPIDRTRLHLVGFSMGGAGTYYIADAFARATGSRFASVTRGVGWSPALDQSSIHETLARSPVWLHVGSTEGSSVTLLRDSYEYLKQIHVKRGGLERREVRRVGQGLLPTAPARLAEDLYSVSREGRDWVRFSTYRDQGHDGDLMFTNVDLFDWIFAQAIPPTEVF